MQDLRREVQTLNQVLRRQSKALGLYEGTDDKLPTLLRQSEEDSRVTRVKATKNKSFSEKKIFSFNWMDQPLFNFNFDQDFIWYLMISCPFRIFPFVSLFILLIIFLCFILFAFLHMVFLFILLIIFLCFILFAFFPLYYFSSYWSFSYVLSSSRFSIWYYFWSCWPFSNVFPLHVSPYGITFHHIDHFPIFCTFCIHTMCYFLSNWFFLYVSYFLFVFCTSCLMLIFWILFSTSI